MALNLSPGVPAPIEGTVEVSNVVSITTGAPLPVSGTIGIAGTVPVSLAGTSAVSVTGTVPVSGTVGISGTVPVSGTVGISGTVPVSGAVNINGTVPVSIAATVPVSGNIAVVSNVQPVMPAVFTALTVTVGIAIATIAGSIPVKTSVILKADSSNTGNIAINDNIGGTITTGYLLKPNDSVIVSIDNLVKIYAVSNAALQKLYVLAAS